MRQYILPIIIGFLHSALIALFTIIFEKQKRRLMIVLVTIIISSVTISLIIIWYNWKPKAQKAGPIFSDFNQCFPVNNYDVNWGVFNDHLHKGNSYITILTRSKLDKFNDCYIEISFHLGERSSHNSYCGIYSGFSQKPTVARNVSHFNGIQFDIWHEDNFPPNVSVTIQISPHKLLYGAAKYHEFDFTGSVKKSKKPSKVRVLFNELILQAAGEIPFDKDYQKELYQIAFAIRGKQGQVSEGKILIDNIEFF